MELSIEAIIYYLIVLDALIANIVAWTGVGGRIVHSSKVFSKYLPITKGWTTLYIVLVIWLGCALSRLEVIGF